MKSLRLFWLLTLLLSGFAASAQQVPPRFEWLRAAYHTAPSQTGTVAMVRNVTDLAGNTYANVLYRRTIRLGNWVFSTSNDGEHCALVKLSPAGEVLWFKPMGSADDSTMWHLGPLSLDAAGNLHATLATYTIIRPGTLLDGLVVPPLPYFGALGIYTATWRPDGQIVEAALAIDGALSGGGVFAFNSTPAPNGDMLLSGVFYGTARIGTILLIQTNGTRHYAANGTGFVARVRPDGSAVWAYQLNDADSTSHSNFNGGVGLDAAGNTYVLGYYSGATAFGGHPLPAAPPAGVGYTQLWAKLDPAGRVVRVHTYLNNTPVAAAGNGRLCFRVRPDGFSFSSASLTRPATLVPGLPLQPTSAQDLLVTAYDPDGAVQWARLMGGTAPNHAFQPVDLQLRGTDRLYVSGTLNGRLTNNGITLPTGGATVLALDQRAGEGLWGVNGSGYGGQVSVAPGGVVLAANSLGDTARFGTLVSVAPPTAGGNQSVLARITESSNTLSGAAYLDANADGIQSATETGFPTGLIVEVNPGEIPCAAPAATGRYDAYLSLLNTSYSASLPNPPPHYTVVAQGAATPATFSTYGNGATGRSFALQPIAGQQDAQVFLTQVSATRPGYPVVYDVTYRNTGTVALPTGTVTLTADARLIFTSAAPAPATTSGATRTWTYANLRPGETRRLRVIFGLPPTTPLGGLVTSGATVTPLAGDLLPLDNISTASRTVTGSFDPNDIEVNHTLLSPDQVAAGEWLEYTIRFQNHGTDTAFTVALHDSLPAAGLRLTTLRVLAASHTCGYGVSATGKLVVTFPGIRLPSQATNLVESDGFIRFRVQPRATLVPGDQIPNRAAIHFDYNEPMLTNTALTTIQTTLGLAGEGRAADAVRVWPNPASGLLHVEAPGTETGPLTLTLTDALGRTVRTTTTTTTRTTATTLDLSGLPAGLYVLHGAGAGAPFSRRVVVR